MKPVNYYCPICRQSNRLPNLKGAFHIISENTCQCNGCNAIFPKSKFYKKVIHNATLYAE